MKTQQTTQTHFQRSLCDLYFLADAENEPFQELTIKTLKEAYIENIYNIVFSSLENPTLEEVDEQVSKLLLQNKTFPLSEYVWFTPWGIEVALNREKITDEIIYETIELVSRYLDKTDKQTWFPLSEPISFELTDVRNYLRQ